MRVFLRLRADAEFYDVCDISPRWLRAHGVRAVALDMDNTIAKYSENEPDGQVKAWLHSLEDAGIRAAIVSNTRREARVSGVAGALGIPYRLGCRKPGRKGFLWAAETLGVRPDELMSIGDQIFTDVWGAKRAGCKAAIVYPRGMDENPLFRLRRLAERPFIALARERYGRKVKNG